MVHTIYFIWLTKLLWFFHWKAVILRKFSKWILFLRVHPNRLKGQQWKNSPSLKRAENAARKIKFSHVQQIKNFNLSVQINWFKRILMIHAECSKFYFNWFDKKNLAFLMKRGWCIQNFLTSVYIIQFSFSYSSIEISQRLQAFAKNFVYSKPICNKRLLFRYSTRIRGKNNAEYKNVDKK